MYITNLLYHKKFTIYEFTVRKKSDKMRAYRIDVSMQYVYVCSYYVHTRKDAPKSHDFQFKEGSMNSQSYSVNQSQFFSQKATQY